jgi:hypothetical protein
MSRRLGIGDAKTVDAVTIVRRTGSQILTLVHRNDPVLVSHGKRIVV